MTFKKNTFSYFIILMVAFTQVASWTIDLPEVRKFLFEKNEMYKKYNKNEYDDYLRGDQKFYSNVEGNSKHNSEDYLHEHHVYEQEKYADEYGYHSYMEEKVHNIVRDGSTYLEGLRRSLEDYSAFLENCDNQTASRNTTSSNTTAWRPEYDPPGTSSNLTSLNSTDNSKPLLNFDNYDNSTIPLKPKNFSETQRPSGRGGRRMSCQEATKASEEVRRYADLAMWATKRLQDLAYAKKYEKADEQEENELILKLAWFLDRLAYLSGYEPVYKEYEPRGTTSATTAPETMTLVPSSVELSQEMMDCLSRNSSEPATVRCQYPMQIPDLMAQMLNISGTRPSSESNNVLPMNTPTDNMAAQSSEILITADNSSPNILNEKSLTKRSTEYTYYYPPKPLHELTYPAPVLKLIKHRLANIKSIVKNIVERRLAHIAEKKEGKEHFEKHFEKRSIDENSAATSNSIDQLSNSKLTVKSLEKKPFLLESTIGLIHYPVSDVSIINTKSFKKRSIEQHRMTSNNLERTSNLKSSVKSAKKGLFRKKFEHFRASNTMLTRLSKHLDSGVKSIKKRYTDDPMAKLANYYIKYKLWDASNPKTEKSSIKKAEIYELRNHLSEPKVIRKRSLFNKKVIHMHIPKPLQIVRTYVNGHRQHLHDNHKPKILTHLKKLHDLKHKKVDKIHKNIKKRSLHYGYKYLPRIPMDPQGDISYYIKNKEGTEYNPSLVQAGQVRLGLEQIFQTGNIEVVRRFGSNYNPLNPAPFYSGVMASMADT